LNNGASGWIEAISPSNSLPTGQWNHVVATYNGSNAATGLKIYINGAEQSVARSANNFPGSGILNNETLKIGTDTGATSAVFGGRLDDVRVYNRLLTSGEVSSLYASGAGCAD
jgi:hypothetical protein